MDAKEHERRVKNARIESLQQSPAWDDLIEMFEQVEENFWRRHVAELRADKKAEKPFDQRKLDRAVGMFDGIRDVLKAPVKAAQKLERLNENNGEEAS